MEAGRGPDIARVTNIKTLADHWLDLTPHIADPAYWQANFGDQFDWMRPDGSNAITGFMTQITLTGGFANKTLFEQAGVPLPGADATWDQWIEAAGKVQDSQQLNVTFVIDRSATASRPRISPMARTTSVRTGCPRRSTKASRPLPGSSSIGRPRAA